MSSPHPINSNFNSVRTYQGKSPKFSQGVYIDPSAVLVGDIEIGSDSSIWPFVAARGDVNFIKIGERTNIQDGSILHVTNKSENNGYGYPLIIGNDVTVGHKSMLHGCVLGNRILVGMSATIMDGAIVEDDVIIGGGSLIAPGKRLESGYLYVGSPARRIRQLTEKELEFLKDSAKNYVYLKDSYLKENNLSATHTD